MTSHGCFRLSKRERYCLSSIYFEKEKEDVVTDKDDLLVQCVSLVKEGGAVVVLLCGKLLLLGGVVLPTKMIVAAAGCNELPLIFYNVRISSKICNLLLLKFAQQKSL
jgi:hypothetical protein